MKKQFAIFTFFIFFLAQFGRVINFCFCTMAAYQETKTFTCDCEKQLYPAVKTDNHYKDQSPQNISAQHLTEQLFQLANFSSIAIHHSNYLTAWPKSNSEALYHVFCKNIFRPPLPFS